MFLDLRDNLYRNIVLSWKKHPWLWVLVATWGLWFLSLWPQWLTIDNQGIATSHLFMWGDWAAHFTFINHLRVQPFAVWFVRNPIFVLAPFTYPPVSSLIPALLMRLGFSLWWAVILPSIVGSFWLLSQLWRWFRAHGLSARSSYFGLSLFLLSGAWGHWQWLRDGLAAARLGDGGESLSYPVAFVTKNFEAGIDWVNPIVSMALPQRAFLLGFPLFLFIVLRLKKRLERKASRQDFAWGIDLGLWSFLLLLTHSHSFFVLGFLSAVWSVLYWRRWRFWAAFVVSTLLLSLPWYLSVLQSEVGGALAFTWNLGWMAPKPLSVSGWLMFWLVNWGWFLPAMILSIGYFVWKRRWDRLRWYAPFLALFIFANIVNTQRWEWDNTKLFVAVLVGLLPALFEVAQVLWQKTRGKKLFRSGVAILFVLLYAVQVLPGTIDLIQLSQPQKARWEIASATDVAFAKKVEALVPVGSPVLTGDLHNQPISMLAGRSLILGFQGWVWSYGFEYTETALDVTKAYAYGDLLHGILEKYNARYVLVGPHERWQFGDELAPELLCSLVIEEGELRLYDCF